MPTATDVAVSSWAIAPPLKPGSTAGPWLGPYRKESALHCARQCSVFEYGQSDFQESKRGTGKSAMVKLTLGLRLPTSGKPEDRKCTLLHGGMSLHQRQDRITITVSY